MTSAARELLDEAQRWIDQDAPKMAEVLLAQGILILRALRAAGITTPAILFADLDEPSRADYLARTLAPLTILPSSESLPSIAKHIRALATPNDRNP